MMYYITPEYHEIKKINYYQVDFIFIDFMANSLQAYLFNEGAICEKNF